MKPVPHGRSFLSACRNGVAFCFNKVGPGIITGASDDDPSGIATYSIAGASLGYGLLWVALITIPMMIAVQEMFARIGLVSGSDSLHRCGACCRRGCCACWWRWSSA